MRTAGWILIFIAFISMKAEAQIPFTTSGYMQQGAFTHYNLLSESNSLQKKWSFSAYSGLAAGYGFFNSANAGFFSAPTGLQLNRRLNKNLYAFAGASATPVYFNFNRSFGNADPSKNFMGSPGFSGNSFGIYPGIQAGLMYVNDAKTFSISGRIGVSGGRYPVYPANRINTQKQPFTGTRQ